MYDTNEQLEEGQVYRRWGRFYFYWWKELWINIPDCHCFASCCWFWFAWGHIEFGISRDNPSL